MRTVATLLLLAGLLGAPGARALVEAAPEGASCAIEGFVALDGVRVAAEVFVARRGPLPSHWHNVQRRAEHIEARLRTPPGDDALVGKAACDERGFYRIGGLEPGCYRVWAVGPGPSRAGAHVPLHVPGQAQSVDLDLVPAPHRLRGRARLADGRGLVAHVLASWGGYADPHTTVVQPLDERIVPTGPDGVFELEGLREGEMNVCLLEPGRRLQALAPVLLPLTTPSEDPVDLQLPSDRHVRHARVLEAETGDAIAGATLAWAEWWPHPICRMAATDVQGRVALGLMRLEVEDVIVRATGRGARYVTLRAGDGMDIPMRRAARLEGRLASRSGGPLAGLRVKVAYVDWQRHRAVGVPATSDAEGRYALDDLDWGSVTIHAWGGEHVADLRRAVAAERPVAARDHLLLEPGRTEVLDIVMDRGEVIEGVVLDAAGVPLVGLPVLMGSSDDPLHGWVGYEAPPIAATDAEGRFRVPGLLRGLEYEFEVRAPGMAPVKAKRRAGALAGPVQLRLSGTQAAEAARRAPRRASEAAVPPVTSNEARWLRVEVTDVESGAPLRGVTLSVMLNDAPGRSARHHLSWVTDDQGRADVGPLPACPGSLDVYLTGYTSPFPLRFAVPPPTGAPLAVRLQREMSIVGRVLTPEGQPASAATVATQSVTGSNYQGQVPCAEDGTFTVPRVRGPFRYRLVARWHDDVRDYLGEVEALGGSSGAEIPLAPVPGSEALRRAERERLRVVLRDVRGRAVTRASVQLGGRPGHIDAQGVVRFEGDVDAQQLLEVWQAAEEDGYAAPLGPVVQVPVGVATGRLTLVLPDERVLEGVVRDEQGRGVGQVHVRAVPVRAWRLEPPDVTVVHDETRTHHDGTFRLGRLGEEPYVVDLLPPEHLLPPRDEVRATATGAPLHITLRSTRSAVVRVLDEAGRPVPGATVEVSRHGWSYFWRRGWTEGRRTWSLGTTGADGRATLLHLDPTLDYSVEVDSPPVPGMPDVEYLEPLVETWRPDGSELVVRLRPPPR